MLHYSADPTSYYLVEFKKLLKFPTAENHATYNDRI